MSENTLQIQSVLYKNEKESLLYALKGLERAIELNKETTKELGEVCVRYGDASPERIFSDSEIEELKKHFAKTFNLDYVYFNENTGSAKGHNLLGENCQTKFMLIMNPDVIVSPRVFHSMLSPFMDPSLKAGMTEGRQTPIEHPKEYDLQTMETDWVTTAFAMFLTEDFHKLSGFDAETFFMYCDDLDFSWRIKLLGKKLYYRPDAVVFHAKSLGKNGEWQTTKAEVLYSAQASILMAYKWSNNKLCKKICDIYRESDNEALVDAVKHFEKLRDEGKLPEQLDAGHKVSKFVGFNYAKHRYTV